MNQIGQEAKRLHNLGFVIHWLRPNSKIPVKSNWTNDDKDDLNALKEQYKNGYNLGVRLGNINHPLTDGTYLAVLDVDLKSSDVEHHKLAANWLKRNFWDLFGSTVETLSGRANGSRHLWMRLKAPMQSQKLYSSPELVEVYMPSAKANKKQLELLGKKKIDKGIRLRPAFEIDFMCSGKQIALPPSIHPDSNKPYKWGRKYGDNFKLSDIKFMDIEKKLETVLSNKGAIKKDAMRNTDSLAGWKPIEVNIFDVQLKLSDKMSNLLFEGDDVDDHSSACFSLALALVKAQYSDDEIMSILTDKDNTYLGTTPYRHAQTNNRARAARWVRDYCIVKARKEVDAAHVFEGVEELPQLSDEDAKKQAEATEKMKHWTTKLERTEKGDRVKPTLKNVILVLNEAVSKSVIKRDEFCNRETYGCDTPWNSKKGDLITDSDVIAIKVWLAQKYRFEPSINIIYEAVDAIARNNTFHPVREFLNGLEWDGIERIDNAFKTYFGGEGPKTYLKEVSRKFFVALIARIFVPGIKFDYIVIFEGKQGKGKSTFGVMLAGNDWFSDSMPDLHDKDAALNLQGTWIQEMGELASLRRGELEITKSFITRCIDKVRPPYGRKKVELKRQTVFFGTTDKSIYLYDKTGNRRFWPVYIKQLDFKAFKADRKQLLAEAMFVWFNLGEKLYLSEEAEKQIEEVHRDKMSDDEEDVMHEIFTRFLCEEVQKEDANVTEFRTSELFSLGGPFEEIKMNNYNLQKAARILKKEGYKKHHKRDGNYWIFQGENL